MPSQPQSQKPLAAIAIRQVEKNTGASRVAFHQMALLSELGYKVMVLAEKGNAELITSQGATLVKLPRWPFKGPFRRFWFNRKVQAWKKRYHPDLLVSHGDATTTDVVYLHNCVHLASQRIEGRPLQSKHEVTAIHDHIMSQNEFHRVAVNSQLMAEELKTRYGISESKIEINYPGYDSNKFNIGTAQINRQDLRTSLRVNSDQFLIGLVTSGNFKKRNVAGFVRIAAFLEQRLPKRCKFLVVGKDDATPYQHQAAQLGLKDQFIWRTTVPDVEHLYGALDVFVLPAHIEEFGCVALEAMACGTPVILSPWVGASELLRHNEYAELVVDGSEEEWAAKIEMLLKNEEREELGQRLSALASNYSNQRQYEKLKSSFTSLINK